MADRIKGITIEIGGDTTRLDKALAGTNKEIKNTQNSLKDVERLLKLDPGNTELLAQKQRLLRDAVTETGDKLKTLRTAAEQANTALAEGKISQDQYDALQRELIETEDAFKRAEKAADDFSNSHGKLSGLADTLKNGVASAADVAGEALKKAAEIGAAAVATATTAVAGFAAAAVQVGAEFDASMSQVAAVSGASGEDFDRLRDKALEMGSKTKFSASEAAEAMNYMAMAGWKTEDMLEGVEGIMSLAAASGENLATTSDIVTDALTALGMGAEDSGHFADVLAAAASNANTNVSMMGETFKYVAPLAGSMGYSADDMAVAIGLMANSGIKATQAGTALRSILTRMASPTNDSYAAMTALGVSLTDTEGNMLSLMDVMKQLRSGFSEGHLSQEEFASSLQGIETLFEKGKINEGEYEEQLENLTVAMYGAEGAEKARLASMLAGKNALSGLLAIVNASDEDFEKLTESIYNADGAAAEMAATMQDNLAGDITIMKSALEGAQIVLSDQLTPTLRDFVQFGTEGISDMANAFQEGGLSGAMEAFGEILSEGLNMLLEMLPQMVDAGMQLLDALGRGIMDNISIVVDAAVEVGTMLLEGFMDALPDILSAGMEIITTLIQGVTKAIPELIPAATEAVMQIAETLTSPDSLGNMIESALELIVALADGLVKAIPELIGEAPIIIENLVQALTREIPQILAAAAELIISLGGGLIDAIPQLAANIPEIIVAIVEGLIAGVEDIADVGEQLVEGLWQGIQNMGDWLKRKFTGFFDNIISSVKELLGIHSPSTVFAGIGENMAAGLGEGWEDEYSRIKRSISSGLDFGSAKLNFVSSGLNVPTVQIAQPSLSAGSGSAPWEGYAPTIREAGGGVQTVIIRFVGELAQLARVLQPIITVETDRRGANLVRG